MGKEGELSGRVQLEGSRFNPSHPNEMFSVILGDLEP